jgi:hypothetical protein
MNVYQKKENQRFIEMIIRCTPENGIYIWPDILEVFTFKNGQMLGSQRGINMVKNITPKEFHSKLRIQSI